MALLKPDKWVSGSDRAIKSPHVQIYLFWGKKNRQKGKKELVRK